MKLTEEKIKKVAQRYGLTTKKVENKKDAGFYFGEKKIAIEDIFPELKNR